MGQKLIDETGNAYGTLTVIKPIKKEGIRKTLWHCQCACGNTIDCSGSDLRTHRRTSCGKHCNAVIQEKSHIIYGFLEVLYQDPIPAKDFPDHCIHWYCKCLKCNTIKSVSGKSLRNGDAISCGCIESKGEQIIAQILNENNINFKKEIKFENLKSNTNTPLRFDFGIYNNNILVCLIEFQGRQHTEENSYFSDSLKDRQERDLLKEKYCENNNINLLLLYQGQEQLIKQKDLIKKELINFINKSSEKGVKNHVEISYSYL